MTTGITHTYQTWFEYWFQLWKSGGVNTTSKMKRTIIDVCAMTSFVIVVMLGASALECIFH